MVEREDALRQVVRQQAVVAQLGQRALAGSTLGVLMEQVVAAVAETLDVEFVKILELFPDRHALRLQAGRGWKDGLVGQATVDGAERSHAGYTLLSGEPVIVTDLQSETRFRSSPLLQDHGVVSGVSVVIAGRERPYGVLGAHTRRSRIFTRDDIHFLQAVAHVLATAIERKRAADAQEFLAEASKVFASSLDYEVTLQSVARLAVPRLADWCAVDIIADEPGADGAPPIHSLVLEHVDPERVELARELRRRYPIDPNAPYGVARVLRTGQPEIVADISEQALVAAARDAEHLAMLRALGLRSSATLPLLARGRTLGAITLVFAESGRRFGPAELALAEELAQRASLAVDSAQLYQRAQRLNDDLKRRAAELVSANKELEAFSYSVSHDLRAPLRAIDGFSRILLEERATELSADAQRYLQIVRENARQMGDLIDDLLSFSRLSRHPLNKQTVQPAVLVRQVLEELQAEQNGRRVDIIVDDLYPCLADPALLKLVFANLLANALKFTRRREVATIEVSCQTRDGEHVYYVRDNGVGFDMRYAHKLFGVFQRLHRADEYEGTGVGLAIVQRIVQRHGGRVWAEAEVEQGATLYFTVGGSTRHG